MSLITFGFTDLDESCIIDVDITIPSYDIDIIENNVEVNINTETLDIDIVEPDIVYTEILDGDLNIDINIPDTIDVDIEPITVEVEIEQC